jgi:hypothetical protein
MLTPAALVSGLQKNSGTCDRAYTSFRQINTTDTTTRKHHRGNETTTLQHARTVVGGVGHIGLIVGEHRRWVISALLVPGGIHTYEDLAEFEDRGPESKRRAVAG